MVVYIVFRRLKARQVAEAGVVTPYEHTGILDVLGKEVRVIEPRHLSLFRCPCPCRIAVEAMNCNYAVFDG